MSASAKWFDRCCQNQLVVIKWLSKGHVSTTMAMRAVCKTKTATVSQCRRSPMWWMMTDSRGSDRCCQNQRMVQKWTARDEMTRGRLPEVAASGCKRFWVEPLLAAPTNHFKSQWEPWYSWWRSISVSCCLYGGDFVSAR